MEIVQKKMEKNLTASGQSEKVTAHTENKIRTMRTKSLLFAAAVGLAGVASAVAQNNVYSVNAVGYINVDLQPGFTMVANQLNSTNNTISSLLATLPNGSNFYKWNGSSFDIATYFFGTWDKPALTLNPGEGGFVNVASATTLTLVGEVTQGSLTNNIPVGFSIRSSQVPQAGTATALGLTAALANGDNLSKWDKANNKYTTYTFFFCFWHPAEPQINVGESFFINHAGSTTGWTRTFSVNQ